MVLSAKKNLTREEEELIMLLSNLFQEQLLATAASRMEMLVECGLAVTDITRLREFPSPDED